MLTRAALVSFLLGIGIGGAHYYTLHQDVWRNTEQVLNLFSHRLPNPSTREQDIPSKESLESHLKKRAIHAWNRSLDVIEDRLVRLPDSFHQVQQDIKATVQKMTDKSK